MQTKVPEANRISQAFRSGTCFGFGRYCWDSFSQGMHFSRFPFPVIDMPPGKNYHSISVEAPHPADAAPDGSAPSNHILSTETKTPISVPFRKSNGMRKKSEVIL
jgi:hypothetical protein